MTEKPKHTPGLVDPTHWRKMQKAPEMYELLRGIVKDYNDKDMDNDTFCDPMMDKARIAEELLSQIDGKEE